VIRFIPVLSLLIVTGCLSKKNFDERFGKVVCKRLKECDPDTYEDFDGRWDCVDQVSAGVNLQKAFSGGDCEFDKEKAKACLSEVREASCNEIKNGGGWGDSCDDVWECKGGSWDTGGWDSGSWDSGNY
jgi:hypothetical protein